MTTIHSCMCWFCGLYSVTLLQYPTYFWPRRSATYLVTSMKRHILVTPDANNTDLYSAWRNQQTKREPPRVAGLHHTPHPHERLVTNRSKIITPRTSRQPAAQARLTRLQSTEPQRLSGLPAAQTAFTACSPPDHSAHLRRPTTQAFTLQ